VTPAIYAVAADELLGQVQGIRKDASDVVSQIVESAAFGRQ
jgi:hypothetical protein